MREIRLSGLTRGGAQAVIGILPLNPPSPAYSTSSGYEKYGERWNC